MAPKTRWSVRLVLSAAVLGAALTPIAAHAQLQYHALTPCRLYDSRTGAPSALGTGGGALTTTLSDSTGLRQLRVRGGCNVPALAAVQAVTLNFTIVGPTAPSGGIGRMCPYPLPAPQTICRAVVLYGPSETLSNGAIMPLGVVTTPGTDDDLQIQGVGMASPGVPGTFTFDWTIDVTGYFQ